MVVINKHSQGELWVWLRLNLYVHQHEAFRAIFGSDLCQHIRGLMTLRARSWCQTKQVHIQKLDGACPIHLVVYGRKQQLETLAEEYANGVFPCLIKAAAWTTHTHTILVLANAQSSCYLLGSGMGYG